MDPVQDWKMCLSAFLPCVSLAVATCDCLAASNSPAAAEPNAEMACGWWTSLQNSYAPVAWKDHPLRFQVLWNGFILANVGGGSRFPNGFFSGAVQLDITPSTDGVIPPLPFPTPVTPKTPQYRLFPDGRIGQAAFNDAEGRIGDQGWNDGDAPVLWTRWAKDGMTFRQEVFAHLAGGGAVKTINDPIFAWIRLSARRQKDTAAARAGFLIPIGAPHIGLYMEPPKNLTFWPGDTPYGRALTPESADYDPKTGWRLLEPDGRIRLAIAQGQNCSIKFTPITHDTVCSYLYVEMPTGEASHVDLLLPWNPAARDVLNAELSLGYDGALRETGAFWGLKPATAARVITPEPLINNAIEQSLKFDLMITEMEPDGQYSKVSGSWGYSHGLWATPGAMTIVMLLDTMGRHEDAAKYLEIFRKAQGTIVAPGPSYKRHPGYFSTPKSLSTVPWLTDHGALLYAISEHALLTGDQAFITHWTDAIVKGCEWIKDNRRRVVNGEAPGVLPAANASDPQAGKEAQNVWADGWNYKGLVTAARLLKVIKHPRADEFIEEARLYREAFGAAMRDACAKTPTWKDKDGKPHHYVPTALNNFDLDKLTFAWYADCGPLFCVYAGLLDADDPLMVELRLDLMSEYKRSRLPQGRPLHVHELCAGIDGANEPCYSWNIFHSWQLGDRQRFLEGMYSVFAGGLSQKTYVSCETRGGLTGFSFCGALGAYLARLAMVDDQIKPGELHLLRMMPLAWLRSDRETLFERMPTEFGPVSVAARLSPDGQSLLVRFEAKFRNQPDRIILHVPPAESLKSVVLNGRPLDWKPANGTREIEMK